MTAPIDIYDMDEEYLSDIASLSSRFSNPVPPLISALYASEFGRSEPAYFRGLSRQMQDLPDRRRAWLVEFADRIEAAGYKSFAEVPAERSDEIAQLY
jgi:hypothetical protein